MLNKFIRDFVEGDQVVGFFVLRKKETKVKKDGSPYLSLELGDRTDRIRGTLWESSPDLASQFNVGDILKIQGFVTSYQEELYIKIEKIRKAVAQDNIDLKQFLPETDKDVRILSLRLFSIIDSLQSPVIKKLLRNIFDDIDFKNKFLQAPAAKLWHQNYIGGLLEHTLQVTEICDKVLVYYKNINRDILIAGSLLHDIGKVFELSMEGFIDYSDKGRLIGHVMMGYEYVARKISDLPELSEPIANQILHIILSHHGEKAQGAPVVPMTLEAMIMHGADYLDSQASAFVRIIQKEKDSGSKWSKYVNLIDRYIYMGEDKK
ncbi:HD domain-containing protein [candidate division KSB1 bacterium]|nr:HD domain-containing protein [candidate division KSB1 bacterium]